jgi:hypothetical protein
MQRIALGCKGLVPEGIVPEGIVPEGIVQNENKT